MELFNAGYFTFESVTLLFLIFSPLLGCVVLGLPFFNSAKEKALGRVATFSFFISLIEFVLAGYLFFNLGSDTTLEYKTSFQLISYLGVNFSLLFDGLSGVLVLLTTFIFPLVFLSLNLISSSYRSYSSLMLIMESTIIGSFLAVDLFVFYMFWELMLLPLFFIIGIWGGDKRIHATIKFILFTLSGSFIMLLAIFYLALLSKEQLGAYSFELTNLLKLNFTYKEEFFLFLAFAFGFGVKIPVFPLHTWLPDAHVEAPTGGSVILAAILLKSGVYGFLRFAIQLFPRVISDVAPYVAILGVIAIIYAALMALVQKDIKRVVAYSSISHLGYCVLGMLLISSVTLNGVVVQMLSHGFVSAALFLLVGMMYNRYHTKEIEAYGGMASASPRLAVIFFIFTLSAIAFPLTSGFVGEFLILTGSFKFLPVLTGIAALGLILGAAYMLTLYKRVFFGKLNLSKESVKDLTFREVYLFIPLILATLWIGIYPQSFLDRAAPALKIIQKENISNNNVYSNVLDNFAGLRINK